MWGLLHQGSKSLQQPTGVPSYQELQSTANRVRRDLAAASNRFQNLPVPSAFPSPQPSSLAEPLSTRPSEPPRGAERGAQPSYSSLSRQMMGSSSIRDTIQGARLHLPESLCTVSAGGVLYQLYGVQVEDLKVVTLTSTWPRYTDEGLAFGQATVEVHVFWQDSLKANVPMCSQTSLSCLFMYSQTRHVGLAF